MKIKKFKQLNESVEDTLGIKSDEIWVVMKYGDTDFQKIFLDKDDAILVCHYKQEEFDKHFTKTTNKYKVLTLWDALDYIRDAHQDINSIQDY